MGHVKDTTSAAETKKDKKSEKRRDAEESGSESEGSDESEDEDDKERAEQDKKDSELSIKRAKEIKKGLDDLKGAALQTQQVASDEWAKQLYGRFAPVQVDIPHPS